MIKQKNYVINRIKKLTKTKIMQNKIKILNENIVYDGFMKIHKASIEEENTHYTREKVERPDAVAIFVYNRQTDMVILTKQFRYAIIERLNKTQYNTNEFLDKHSILEVVAGKIDFPEKPEETAIRELEEEIGYVVDPDDLIYISKAFTSPGYSTEIIHNFAVSVTNKNKKKDGGGVKSEHENIEVVEIPSLEFMAFAENGTIRDMKTKLLYYEAKGVGIFNIKSKTKRKKVIKIIEDKNQIKLL